jgi:hypothetical protein
MLAKDVVLYNGRKYYRFPNHKGLSKANYYWSAWGRVGYLHRHIYEDVFGEIASGMHIHHKDGNKLNNHPSNLECLTRKEHWNHHVKDGMYEKRKLPIKTCVVCDKRYQATGFTQRYCSSDCKSSVKRRH